MDSLILVGGPKAGHKNNQGHLVLGRSVPSSCC